MQIRSLLKTAALSAFIWFGLSAHAVQARANVAPVLQRLEAPAVRCDFLRNENSQTLERARPASHHQVQSKSSSAPTPAFERAPDTWHDLNLSWPSTFVAAQEKGRALPSLYLFRSGLSPPSAI